MTPFDMDRGLAAVLLSEVSQTLERFKAFEIADLDEHEPLPRGLLTCGQANRFLPVLLILISERVPDLMNPDALAEALHSASLSCALSNGALNGRPQLLHRTG